MKAAHYLLIALALLALLGCASTRIRTDDGVSHEIYVNDTYMGDGEARVGAMGPPRTVTVEARDGGQVVGSTTMSRQIRFTSVALGFFCYFTSLYWAQYYPDEVVIPIVAPATRTAPHKSWDSPLNTSTSAWDSPVR